LRLLVITSLVLLSNETYKAYDVVGLQRASTNPPIHVLANPREQKILTPLEKLSSNQGSSVAGPYKGTPPTLVCTD